MFDCVFERQLLEGVERVVVDEDADWTLRRQEVREIIDHPVQRMIGGTVVVGHQKSRS